MKKGFDHQKYIEMQSKYIIERVNQYDKLYIEFGGKLMADRFTVHFSLLRVRFPTFTVCALSRGFSSAL